ncbi:MAG TPA: hypothetical protein VKV57_03825 [bacterium]|nr:hypothetical protein [bacterium]
MSSLKQASKSLFILGTGLVIYWQPLGRWIPIKPSDIVFILGLCAWMLVSLKEKRTPQLSGGSMMPVLPILALLVSVLGATLAGYLRYHLAMTREGAILLIRLAVCMALFLAVGRFALIDRGFRRRTGLALLSPIALFPAMLVPAVALSMWGGDGRFQGLTVNPNTADLAFIIALALAGTLAMHAVAMKHPRAAAGFSIVAIGMLTLIVWTESRAYLVGAFASVIVGGALTASSLKLPKLRVAAAAAGVCAVAATASVLLGPPSLAHSYLIRMSLETSAAQQTEALSNWARISASGGPPPQASGRRSAVDRGAFGRLVRFRDAIGRRLIENPHVQAAAYYAQLLSTNSLGFGVNYGEKFFIYFPWINRNHQGANSILDVPVYGGIGAVLSVAYLMFLVARRIKEHLAAEADETTSYGLAAAAALGGLWVAAILLGSPIFDYQFWIVSAIALS